jgi:hypothetical protein
MSTQSPRAESELATNRIAGLLAPEGGGESVLEPEADAGVATDEAASSDEAAYEEVISDDAAEQETVDPEREEFERHFDEAQFVASWHELVLGATSLAAWFMLFTGGTLIATGPYIAEFSAPLRPLRAIQASLVIAGFWTISNVGLLSILAAVLGAFGQRTRFTAKITAWHAIGAEAELPRPGFREVLTHYASAIMRGFGVYTLVLSGLLVLATEAIVSPTQGQYVRLAGLVSVISFYAGYEPAMLADLLKRIERFLKTD